MPHRQQRADATENNARLLEVARRAFARSDGEVSLAEIAAEAEVGIATLYRHFATREALARAVFADAFGREVKPHLLALLQSGVTRELQEAATQRFADFLDSDRQLIAAIGDVAGATRELFTAPREAVQAALYVGKRAGNLRNDLEPEDLINLFALIAAALVSQIWSPAMRRRYVGLILDGCNPGKTMPLHPRDRD